MFETTIANNPKLANLTPQRALELIERAVQEKGEDYVDNNAVSDNGCRYFNPETGAPECIVGHVLAYEGFTYEDFPMLNYVPQGDYLAHFGPRSQTNSASALFDRNPDLAEVLSMAQNVQDDGETWGHALASARIQYEARNDAKVGAL